MDGMSSAGKFLLTCTIIGGTFTFWFWNASTYTTGRDLDFSHTAYLPVTCSITGDRIADVRQAGQAYFWQGSARLDVELRSSSETTLIHEIIKPGGMSYLWRDGSGYGKLSKTPVTYTTLVGAEPTTQWFCYPWVFLDFLKVTVPGNITFE